MKNEDDFRKQLKQIGKNPTVIDGLVKEVYHFRDWLLINKNKTLETAEINDLLSYAKNLNTRELKIYMRALALFYRWLEKDELKELAHSLREAETSKTRRFFNLREFQGVNLEEIGNLEALGIRNVEDMLSAGRTPQMRKEMAERSGVSHETIMELVKLADLSRLPGVKGIRARLYYNAGIDTVEAFCQWKPVELQKHLEKFVRDSRFDGVAPLPKEIQNTIKTAAKLPRIIQF